MKCLRIFVLSLFLLSLSSLAEEKGKSPELRGPPIQKSCEKEFCSQKKSKELCGQCCKEKYRFTNSGSDDNNPKLLNLVTNFSPELAWDECIECCKVAFPEKGEVKNPKRDRF